MNHKANWINITLGLLVILGAIAGLYLKQKTETVVSEITVIETPGDCDPVVQVCSAGNDLIKLELHFPEQPVYLAPFPLQVSIAGNATTEVDSVIVDFQMSGMDMGINKTVLSKVTQADRQEQQVWSGKMILPVCVAGRADWQALVLVSAGANRYQAAFPVKVVKTEVNSN